MSVEVPLKVRVDVRDLWDPKGSDVHAASNALEKTLGHKVIPQAEWPALWNELKDKYHDRSTFVPTISRIAVAWFERLQWRLECDNFPEWTEEFLNFLSEQTTPLRLEIEPSPPPHSRPRTYWRANTKTFYLGVPKTDPIPQGRASAGFDEDFDSLLKGNAGPNEEGWADVASEAPPPPVVPSSRAPPRHPPTAPARPGASQRQEIKRLPTVTTLPRPSELFQNSAPYILSVISQPGSMLIRCSHEPSLQLIMSYFEKWGKTNIHDNMKRNHLKIEILESTFCHGVNDTLLIEPHMNHNFRAGLTSLNPTVVLAFIESVLGYKLVHTDGHVWMYRCETILR